MRINSLPKISALGPLWPFHHCLHEYYCANFCLDVLDLLLCAPHLPVSAMRLRQHRRYVMPGFGGRSSDISRRRRGRGSISRRRSNKSGSRRERRGGRRPGSCFGGTLSGSGVNHVAHLHIDASCSMPASSPCSQACPGCTPIRDA